MSRQKTDPEAKGHEVDFVHLLEVLPTPAYVCAPNGLITCFNQHAVRLWGCEPRLSDPANRFCGPLKVFSTSGFTIPHDQCYMALALQTDTECVGQEMIIQSADGRRAAVLAHAKPLHDPSGKLTGALGIFVDISAQREECHSLRDSLLKSRQLERKIFEYSESEQSQFTHHLHEDLGQQLTGIALLARVLGKRLCEESHAEMHRVMELAQLASECIGTARDLAKRAYPLELDHGGLIMALEDLANRIAYSCRVSCEVVHDESFRFEPTSAIHLYRIVQEVVENAIRRSFARKIVIECKARDGVPALAVTHDGIPLKYLMTQANSMELDLLHSRARLFGARLEIQKSAIGGKVICWLGE